MGVSPPLQILLGLMVGGALAYFWEYLYPGTWDADPYLLAGVGVAGALAGIVFFRFAGKSS